MDAKLLEERTVFIIGPPSWVERIRCAPDFGMPTDAGVRCFVQLLPDDFPVGRPRSGICGEFVSVADGVPISLHHPAAAFVGVPVFAPPQEAVP